jgi:predicted permease
MASDIATSFLGALQASLSVLLTIGAGVVASRYNLLKEASGRDISKLCVRLMLPALLIVNVGEEVTVETAARYLPILSKSASAFLVCYAYGD